MKLFLLMSLATVTLHIKEVVIGHNGRARPVIDVCTGVYVGPQTVLTAAHCVKGDVGEVWAKEDNDVIWKATIIAKQPDEDLALLHIAGKPHAYVKLGHDVRQTDRVFTVNSGEDYPHTYGEGVVENIISIDETKSPVIMDGLAIFAGASGSGLFDRKGQLIGINIMKAGAISFAVNTPTIRTFLAINGIASN